VNARGGRYYCRTCRRRGCGRRLILSCSKRKCRLHMRGFWHELFLTILKLCFDPFALRTIFTRINNNNIQAPGSPPELRLNYFFDHEIRSVGIFRAGEADRSGKKNKYIYMTKTYYAFIPRTSRPTRNSRAWLNLAND
jgi:hypothetical protein